MADQEEQQQQQQQQEQEQFPRQHVFLHVAVSKVRTTATVSAKPRWHLRMWFGSFRALTQVLRAQKVFAPQERLEFPQVDRRFPTKKCCFEEVDPQKSWKSRTWRSHMRNCYNDFVLCILLITPEKAWNQFFYVLLTYVSWSVPRMLSHCKVPSKRDCMLTVSKAAVTWCIDFPLLVCRGSNSKGVFAIHCSVASVYSAWGLELKQTFQDLSRFLWFGEPLRDGHSWSRYCPSSVDLPSSTCLKKTSRVYHIPPSLGFLVWAMTNEKQANSEETGFRWRTLHSVRLQWFLVSRYKLKKAHLKFKDYSISYTYIFQQLFILIQERPWSPDKHYDTVGNGRNVLSHVSHACSSRRHWPRVEIFTASTAHWDWSSITANVKPEAKIRHWNWDWGIINWKLVGSIWSADISQQSGSTTTITITTITTITTTFFLVVAIIVIHNIPVFFTLNW